VSVLPRSPDHAADHLGEIAHIKHFAADRTVDEVLALVTGGPANWLATH